MTRILLIRHATTGVMGTTLCGRTLGISLNQEGRMQAAALGQTLSARTIEAIYCSPLERAHETAEAIAKPRGLVPLVDDRFIELDFGRWTGKTFDELSTDPLWNEYNRVRSSVTPPGGEPPLQARERYLSALRELASRHDGLEIAVVTHADVIRLLLTSLLSMELDDLLRFQVAPASVTEVWYGGDCPVVKNVNVQYAAGR